MKIKTSELRKSIREDLARGIPDYAFTRPVENAVDQLVNDLIRILVVHVNQTSSDSSTRNRRYAAANRVAAALRKDREFIRVLEDKLKEKLLIFFDDAR
jgi:hypothetical protein